MNRDHTAPFQKRGARAERVALREAEAAVERGCEEFVRSRTIPQQIEAARQAARMFRQRG